ncbi:hypothetical protein BH10PSE1_BH10PSE1_18370 [soil metagenome]
MSDFPKHIVESGTSSGRRGQSLFGAHDPQSTGWEMLDLVGRASRPTRRGEPLNSELDGLGIVRDGIAFITHPTGLCIAIAGAGQTLGPWSADPTAKGRRGVWMTDGAVTELSHADILHFGSLELFRLGLRAAALHQEAVEAEFVCSRRHSATPRLARWILRLSDSGALPIVTLGQAELAELSGLRRTSVCAAMSQLQTYGGLKVPRGRIFIQDRKALSRIACRCGDPEDEAQIAEMSLR